MDITAAALSCIEVIEFIIHNEHSLLCIKLIEFIIYNEHNYKLG